MTFETVSYETNGPVARVTLNRPEVYNAFDKTLRAELSAVFDLVEAAEGIRVCILKGAGKGFSAGGDITDFGYDPISDLIVGEFLPLFEKVDKGNVIYIAQIHGSCAGIAAALAMTCDFITMAEDSALYMAFAAIALAPDGGNTFHLMNAMGYRRALEAIIEGRHIPAPECKALGIANRVHPAPELETETMAWATRIGRYGAFGDGGDQEGFAQHGWENLERDGEGRSGGAECSHQIQGLQARHRRISGEIVTHLFGGLVRLISLQGREI